MFIKSLLIFVPISIGLALLKVNPLVVFVCSCLAIVPLADLLADFTEQLAEFLGPTLGGLLNATLGNAPELIISGFALSKGLTAVVKASISGSILMNLLLSLGVSMVAGGLRFGEQKFHRKAAGMSAALLTLAAIALIVPAGFRMTGPAEEEELSLGIAIVLFIMYILGIVFVLRGGHGAEPGSQAAATEESANPKSGRGIVLAKLAVTAGLLAACSEFMTDSLEPAMKALHLSQVFAGVIVLASLGNIAEMIAAVKFARRNKMDLAVGSTVGSATQAALVVAPALVFAGHLMGQKMDLQFSPFEVLAIALSVMAISQVTSDGESNWMEGAMLVAVYLVFAIGFFFLDDKPGTSPSRTEPRPLMQMLQEH